MIVCSLGIAGLHLFQGHPLDSFILPFILLLFGNMVLLGKPDDAGSELKMGKKVEGIVFATLSITLIAGIVVMLALV